jgi:ribonuclease P protein component
MPAASGARLRPRERLRTGAEYRRVFRRGARVDSALFLLVAVENRHGHFRLGLAAGRKVGSAVQRNRARRLLRESFRKNKHEGAAGLDLVLVAKHEIVGRSQTEVEREFRECLRRLAARPAGRRGPAAPARD